MSTELLHQASFPARACVVLVALPLVVGACTPSRRASDAGSSAAVPFSPAASAAAERALLDAWTTAHAGGDPSTVIATGELLTQQGEWTDGTDPETHKLAYVEGLVSFPADATVTGRPATVVRWADGSSVTVTGLSPADALAQVPHATPADADVAPLVVVAATATTVQLATTRGHADVPAWSLTLRDSPVRLTVVAAPVTVPTAATSPGRDLDGVGVGVAPADGVTVGPDDRTLTVHLTGAPDDAGTFCGEDYSVQTVASAAAVVVAVVRHPYDGPTPSAGTAAVGCTLVGAARQAVTVLDAPLADRPVLDLWSALPLGRG